MPPSDDGDVDPTLDERVSGATASPASSGISAMMSTSGITWGETMTTLGRPRLAPARRSTLIAIVLTLSVVAAACGSKGAGNDAATPPTAAPTDNTVAASGPPKAGGTLRYAVDGESDGFDPTKNRWATAGTEIGLTIFDPLAAYDTDTVAQPYLAQSFTPNAEFTRWTVTLRSGITFHDGTPLTAAVLKTIFAAHQASPLTHPAVADLDHVEVTGELTADFVMKVPWAAFPSSLTGQLGMVPSPAMLADPSGSRHPVGTGPFVFGEWVPDNHLTVTRSSHYWRTDTSGRQLPYLDGVNFSVIPEPPTAVQAMQAGNIDMAYTSVPSGVVQVDAAVKAGKLQSVENTGETEEAFIQLNLGSPPFDNPNARAALAYATNQQDYIATVDQGVNSPVDNVFRQGTPYYRDAPYPAFDLEKAKQMVKAYEQDTGQPLSFSLLTVSTNDGRLQGQFLKQAWEQAGMKVDLTQDEQSSLIVDAVTGKYQSVAWGQFGSPDPDYDYVWWISDNAAPKGQFGLNIARNKDPEIDKALRAARASADPAVRRDSYATVAARLNQDLPYIWLARGHYLVFATNSVRGLTNGPLPDGRPSYPMGGPGGFGMVTQLTQTWLDT
jgi:peptide/nickel transport system substrate-binding protein